MTLRRAVRTAELPRLRSGESRLRGGGRAAAVRGDAHRQDTESEAARPARQAFVGREDAALLPQDLSATEAEGERLDLDRARARDRTQESASLPACLVHGPAGQDPGRHARRAGRNQGRCSSAGDGGFQVWRGATRVRRGARKRQDIARQSSAAAESVREAGTSRARLTHYHPAVLRRLRIDNLVLIREAELAFAPGLNAITGETGAGKTILAQAVGPPARREGRRRLTSGRRAAEAYVEAELDLPDGLLDEDGFEAVAELRPEDEDGLVIARRVSSEGADPRLRVGQLGAPRGVAAPRRAVDRDVGPVRAAPARASRVPAGVCSTRSSATGAAGGGKSGSRPGARCSQPAAATTSSTATRLAVEARLAELRALAEDTDGLEPRTEESLLRGSASGSGT